MLKMKSPLRYPGGKSRGASQIMRYFPSNLEEMVSPFFGGGSIELQTASTGARVYGYDAFRTLVDFWQELISNPEALSKSVLALYPMLAERYKELQRSFNENSWAAETRLDRAARYYAVNRTSFSGIGLFGSGMSLKTERFRTEHIQALAKFRVPQLSVDFSDFRTSLSLRPSMFAYCDPPYFLDGKRLYGKLHSDFDHEELCRLLRSRRSWLLSYDDCPEVRALYSGFRIESVSWSYGMANGKKDYNASSKEVVILSDDLEEPQPAQPLLF